MAHVTVEPSVFIGDATCPQCGHLLWFIQTDETIRLYDLKSSQADRNRVIEIIAKQLGIDRRRIVNNPSLFDAVNADSLDVVELVMAIEEEPEGS